MSAVPWQAFCFDESGRAKFATSWLLVAGNVTSTFRDGSQWCRLCGSPFVGVPQAHVAGHEPDLRTWQRANGRAAGAELEAKLAEALELVDGGMSQRQAATTTGIPRTTLGDALRSRAGTRSGVAEARTRVPAHRGAGPPVIGPRSGARAPIRAHVEAA